MANEIVVGFDGSPRAHDALALARVLARAAVGRVVVAGDDQDSGVGEEERVSLVGGSPADALRDLAAERKAVAIVVGSTDRGPIGRITTGSVARQLLAGAPCSVAVAPAGLAERGSALDTIGVAYDDSAESQRALEGATRLAGPLDARVSIVSVFRWASPSTGDRDVVAGETGYVDEGTEDLRRKCRAAMETVPERSRGDVVVEAGDPASVIAERSGGLELLICGSRGRGPLHQVLLGSVSAELVDRAACSLIVIPRGGQRVEDA